MLLKIRRVSAARMRTGDRALNPMNGFRFRVKGLGSLSSLHQIDSFCGGAGVSLN